MLFFLKIGLGVLEKDVAALKTGTEDKKIKAGWMRKVVVRNVNTTKIALHLTLVKETIPQIHQLMIVILTLEMELIFAQADVMIIKGLPMKYAMQTFQKST